MRHKPAGKPYCLALAIACCLTAGIATAEETTAAERPGAIVIQLDRVGRPLVRELPSAVAALSGASRGLCIWDERGQDRWQNLDLAKPASSIAALDDPSRAGDEAAEPSFGVAMLTAQLDPLVEPEITRAAGLLTPPSGPLLDGRITIRRRPQADDPKYPKATFILQSGERIARISLEQGQSRIPFRQIATQLPPAWKAGLPPGQYSLRSEAGLENVAFSVEEDAVRLQVTRHLQQLRQARLGPNDPLYVQVAVELLMNHKDRFGHDRPYLADALDALENLPQSAQTPYLCRQRQQVLWLLGAAAKPADDAPAPDSVGIGPLDRVRELILRGMWSQAQSDLGGLARSEDARTRALATLYQAVVVAEAGLGGEYADPTGRYGQDADAGFRQALQYLEGGSASDRLRAHHDYANFLLRQAQDRLHNHAFQMAAGVEHPLLTAMITWGEAQRQFEAARDLATAAEDRAAIDVSLARLYTLLAEIVATIDSHGDAALAAINRAALRLGGDYASLAVAEETASPAGASTNGSFIIAIAEEMKAQLAFRLGDWKACKEHAEAAQALYGQIGSLIGEESIHRLLGLYYLRANDTAAKPRSDVASRQTALQHFLIAHALSEVLRERFPADRTGLSRAGFFARRAYATEMIVELLLEQGKDQEALGYAEAIKSRALQDLLSNAGIHGRLDAPNAVEFADVLANWPRGVAAMEYFLGRQRAWVFVVDTNARVKAYPLVDADGKPLDSRALVARIHTFLNEIGFQAPKMRRRLLAGQGYDHSWQDVLHRFQCELAPPAALASLRKAATVIVVPQHLLHYFPFAALVTKLDDKPRGTDEMVQPRFMLDEPFDLSYAPSLSSWAIVRDRKNRPVKEASMVGLVEVAGDPNLPGVARDLDSVKTVFHDRLGGVYFAEAATVANAKRALGHSGLVLLAAHGMNVADRPLQSYLVLQPQEGSDGRLTAADLFQTRVAADLVVMNACYSGLADASPLPGDDLFGLQRALLHGGVRTVVAGLWDVYDGTAPELIRGMLARVAAGQAAPAALAQSQREFLKKLRASGDAEPWLHPYFWAVYTVAGDDRTGRINETFQANPSTKTSRVHPALTGEER
jgi:CHAT domain-containing protein